MKNYQYQLAFKKYSATGNDFILVDNRAASLSATDQKLWQKLCGLKTGIGADGVLLVEDTTNSRADFKMRYINADGGEVSMCGNGARAITAFFRDSFFPLKNRFMFETMNGIYECAVDSKFGYRLKMSELYDIDKFKLEDFFPSEVKHSRFLNTGVPHAVFEVHDVENIDIISMGKKVRYDARFPEGANANFYQFIGGNRVKIRTYERGVENETLSCGTGAVATALTASWFHRLNDEVILETRGGELAVSFSGDLKEIYLCGKVEKIFEGTINV